MKNSVVLFLVFLALRAPAATGLVVPAEFAPASELQMTAETFLNYVADFSRIQDRVGSFTVLARSTAAAEELREAFRAAGGRSAKLRPRVVSHDSFWFQDFGPIYVRTASGIESRDFSYTRYNRVRDDEVPGALGALDGTVNVKVALRFEGGNFISDGAGTCFSSTRIYEQNSELPPAEVRTRMKSALGCDRLVTLAPLVDDVTFHIDLFAKLVGPKTFIVGDFIDHPVNRAAMDRNARALEALGYRVLRLPVRNAGKGYATHLNSFLLNGTVLLPEYGIPEDETAEALYTDLGYRVEKLSAAHLIGYGGALHCILRSRPQ